MFGSGNLPEGKSLERAIKAWDQTARAFSSEVDTGSREENASQAKS